MKKTALTLVTLSLISILSGCVFVRDRKPDTVTTTRQTTVSTPVGTSVERTTVY